MTFTIHVATSNDLDAVKALCDDHRIELGFVMRPSLAESIRLSEILVAVGPDGTITGIVHYHHRRDEQTTLYHLAVQPTARGQGIGRAMIKALRDEAAARGKAAIRLKCPVTLPANHFYAHVGFVHIATDPGKARMLNVWELPVK